MTRRTRAVHGSAASVESVLCAVDRHIGSALVGNADAFSDDSDLRNLRSEVVPAFRFVLRPDMSSMMIESVRQARHHFEVRIRFAGAETVLVIDTLWRVGVDGRLRMIGTEQGRVERVERSEVRAGVTGFRGGAAAETGWLEDSVDALPRVG